MNSIIFTYTGHTAELQSS